MIFPRPCAWPGYCKRVAWWLWSPYCRVHRFELRLFLKDDAAGSPVMSILLMVSFVVVLAAVVFTLVSGLGVEATCS